MKSGPFPIILTLIFWLVTVTLSSGLVPTISLLAWKQCVRICHSRSRFQGNNIVFTEHKKKNKSWGKRLQLPAPSSFIEIPSGSHISIDILRNRNENGLIWIIMNDWLHFLFYCMHCWFDYTNAAYHIPWKEEIET